MTQKKTEKRFGFRHLLISVAIIVFAVLAFNFCNRSKVNGSNATSELAVFDHSDDFDTSDRTEVVILSTSNFDQIISKGVVLVDFWATWCPPCRIQGPIIKDLAVDIGGLATISKLDVDQHGQVAQRYQVRSIPTLIIFKDGEPVRRFVGVQQKETLDAAIREYL